MCASSDGLSEKTKFAVLSARFKGIDNTHSKGEGLEIFNLRQKNLFFDLLSARLIICNAFFALGGTPLYRLYRYVRRQRVCFFLAVFV